MGRASLTENANYQKELGARYALMDASRSRECTAARARITHLLSNIPPVEYVDVVDTTEPDSISESLRAPEIDVFVPRSEADKQVLRSQEWTRIRENMAPAESFSFDVQLDPKEGGLARQVMQPPLRAPKQPVKYVSRTPGASASRDEMEAWLADMASPDIYPPPPTRAEIKAHREKEKRPDDACSSRMVRSSPKPSLSSGSSSPRTPSRTDSFCPTRGACAEGRGCGKSKPTAKKRP